MTEVMHAVPLDASDHGHRADRACYCSPRAMRDLDDPSRIVFAHRKPFIGDRRTSTGGTGDDVVDAADERAERRPHGRGASNLRAPAAPRTPVPPESSGYKMGDFSR